MARTRVNVIESPRVSTPKAFPSAEYDEGTNILSSYTAFNPGSINAPEDCNNKNRSRTASHIHTTNPAAVTSHQSRWANLVGYAHSNYREMLAILMAIRSFGRILENKTVQILSDNIAAVAYINHLGGPSMQLNQIVKAIWAAAYHLNIELQANISLE